jgi:hypothetical protein
MTQSPHKAVTLERLEQLLDAYGAEPSRWPDAERAAAEQLISSDGEAQKLLMQARSLDDLLDLSELPDAASAGLRARVLEIPIRHAHTPASVLPRFGWKLALFAFAPCVLGFLSGNLLLEPATDSEDDAWAELAQVVGPVQLDDELALFDEEAP